MGNNFLIFSSALIRKPVEDEPVCGWWPHQCRQCRKSIKSLIRFVKSDYNEGTLIKQQTAPYQQLKATQEVGRAHKQVMTWKALSWKDVMVCFLLVGAGWSADCRSTKGFYASVTHLTLVIPSVVEDKTTLEKFLVSCLHQTAILPVDWLLFVSNSQ